MPRLDLLKFLDSEGMVAVMVPSPGKERRVGLAVQVQVEEEVDAGKYIHHRPRVKQPGLGFSKLWQSPNLTRLIRMNCRP